VRFSLQDVRKSIRRRGGELQVGLHFLRSGEMQNEISRLIAYHEQLLNQPQRAFSSDDARACVGEYRLAHCLIATLSHWYVWRSRDWSDVVRERSENADLLALGSPVPLRLELFRYVNEQYHGYLPQDKRQQALHDFAMNYQLTASDLEYLLALDSDDEMLLTREGEAAPQPQDVITLYNQWVFEAALMNASQVHFVIDCAAFSRAESIRQGSDLMPVAGIGAVIKRLCFLARRLGVYYELEYASVQLDTVSALPLLSLTLYGPQEVTGAPQQYGLRLTRLCRLLLGYGVRKDAEKSQKRGAQISLTQSIVSAEARVHFLQRAYTFVMDEQLLRLLPQTETQESGTNGNRTVQLFDSSVEQSFAEAFVSLSEGHGTDGWHFEREPEPLLLPDSLFIPDFAFTRGEQRVYVEILGFWTPSYRERKIQKLRQLRARKDIVLAAPMEAKDAFAEIAADFPFVYYQNQLSATDLLQVLRTTYDDFAERLAAIDMVAVQTRIAQDGFVREQICYELLHCYRWSELQQAAVRVCADDTLRLFYVAGLGCYQLDWFARFEQRFVAWMREEHAPEAVPLSLVVQEIKQRWSELSGCDDVVCETLLGLCTAVTIRRDSIFDAQVSIIAQVTPAQQDVASVSETEPAGMVSQEVKGTKEGKRERKTGARKRLSSSTDVTQGGLWE